MDYHVSVDAATGKIKTQVSYEPNEEEYLTHAKLWDNEALDLGQTPLTFKTLKGNKTFTLPYYLNSMDFEEYADLCEDFEKELTSMLRRLKKSFEEQYKHSDFYRQTIAAERAKENERREREAKLSRVESRRQPWEL